MHAGRQTYVAWLCMVHCGESPLRVSADCPHAPDGRHPFSRVTWGRHRCGAAGMFIRGYDRLSSATLAATQRRLRDVCHDRAACGLRARLSRRRYGALIPSVATQAPCLIDVYTHSCACPTASAQPRNAGCFATPDRAWRRSVEHGTAQHEPKGGQFCGNAGACAQSAQRGRWQRVRGSGQQLNASMRACHGPQPA